MRAKLKSLFGATPSAPTASSSPAITAPIATERPDLRSETDRTPGPHKPPAARGEFRNVYRRADGSERHGCTWSTRGAAEEGREVLKGETFLELRDMRNATSMALAGVGETEG